MELPDQFCARLIPPLAPGPWDAPRWPLCPEIYSQTVHERQNPFPMVESVTGDFQPRSANVGRT
jgi:hypothetical protein